MPTNPTNATTPLFPNTLAQNTLLQNKALARQFIEKINAQDLDSACALLAPDWVDHTRRSGLPNDAEGAKAFFAMQFAAFPDMHATVEDMIAEGDKVVTRLNVTGTNNGSMTGIPATGKQVNFSVTDIHRIVAGKFVEHWSNSDDLGMMQQLGLIPPPQGQ